MKSKINPLSTVFSGSDRIILSPRQIEIINQIHEQGSYFNILRSPANVGKTFFACVLFAVSVMRYSSVGETNFIVTYDARSFTNTIASLLKSIFAQLGEDVRLHDRTTSIQLSNGATISYISACSPNPESKTRGSNLSFVLVDELSKINEELIYALLSRLRNNPYRKLIATTNADSVVSGVEFNWVFENFFRNDKYKKIDKKYLNVVRLTHDDAYVSDEKMKEYHDMMRQFLPRHLLSNFIDDEFDVPQDLIYYEVMNPNNRVVVSDYVEYSNREFYVSIDYGYGHRCGIILYRHSGLEEDPIIIEDSVARNQMVVSDIFTVIATWSKEFNFDLKDLSVTCDPSAPLVIDELGRCGLTVSPAFNSVDYGITICNLLAKRGLLKITTRAKSLITELSGFNRSRKSKKIHDDLADSMRYGLSTYFEWLGRSVSGEDTNELLSKLLTP